MATRTKKVKPARPRCARRACRAIAGQPADACATLPQLQAAQDKLLC